MKNEPLVSVLIPCYNVEPYIEECLISIINQTQRNLEIVCIDDCSGDRTWSVLKFYQLKDQRIKLFKNKVNLGVTQTRNKLLDLASGEFVVKMDADDVALPERIEELLKAQKMTTADIVSSDYKIIDSRGKIIKKRGFDLLFSQAAIKFVSLFNSPLPHAPSMFKVQSLKELKYDMNYVAAEDYHFLTQLLLRPDIRCKVVDKPLYLYRQNFAGMSFTNNEIQIKNHIKIAREAIRKVLDIEDTEHFDFWNIQKRNYDFRRASREKIRASFQQIVFMYQRFIFKVKVTETENNEIKFYLGQYLFLTYYSAVKLGIQQKQTGKVLSIVFLEMIKNYRYLLTWKIIRWTLKNL